ncbi:MAG: aminotransferase class I/II-fold pyridoxal phosphate-dependent enzyme [Oscillospiraceae bacterium]
MDYNSIIAGTMEGIKPSAIRKFFDILAEMSDAISLGIGEPDFITPYHIRNAGIESLERGYTKYTANAGMSELRREVSKYLIRRFDLAYNAANELFITVGGSEAIDLAIRAIVNPDDEVIVPEPSFVCYVPIVQLAHGVPVILDTFESDDFRIRPEELEKLITPKTKAVVLPYPNNPTGGILEKEDLEKIAEILRDKNIMVVSDEIYAELTYGGRHVSIASMPGMRERTIVVNGLSKSHAMTGWRMGYVCGPKEIISQMAKIHQYAIMCAPTTSQYAAIKALREGDHDVETMRESYDQRRRLLVEGVRALGLSCFEPRGAFYAFPCIKSTGLSSAEFCERFLMEEKVAVIPGNAFGESGEGFVRCCYAASEEDLRESLRRLERFLKRLRGQH